MEYATEAMIKVWTIKVRLTGRDSSPVRVFHVQSIGETVTLAPENLSYA